MTDRPALAFHGKHPVRDTKPMENGRPREGHGEHPGRHYPPDDFGPTLAAGRARASLGLRQAARAADISLGYWCLLEHGERSPSESVAELVVATLNLTGADAAAVRDAAVTGVGRDYPRPPKPLRTRYAYQPLRWPQ
jgi:hypothetical protein